MNIASESIPNPLQSNDINKIFFRLILSIIAVATTDPTTSPMNSIDPSIPIPVSVNFKSVIMLLMAEGTPPWSRLLQMFNQKTRAKVLDRAHLLKPKSATKSILALVFSKLD